MSEHISESTESPCDIPQSFRSIEFVSYLLFGVGPLVGNAVLTLLGPVATEFLVDPTAVLIAIPAFMFPFAFIQLFSGALSDSYGRVPVIAGGLVGLMAGLFLISFTSSITMFALGHLVSGVGFGFANPVLLALLSDCAVPEDIPKRMGIASGLAGLGVGLGPFVAGQMVILGWQLYYLAILSIVFIGLVAISIANRPPTIIHGETGIRVLINNLKIELRKPVVLLMVVTTFLVAMVYLGTLIWTSRGLTGAVSENTTGIMLLVVGIFGATAGISLGSIIRRRGFGFSIAIAVIPLFASLSLFILIGDITILSSIPLVGLSLVLMGWAGGVLLPLMITYSQLISPERRGVLAGVVTCSSFFGAAIVPTVYEPLFYLGMQSLYIGILGVSFLLIVFISIFFKRVEAEMKLQTQLPSSL
ncbi:MAG: MFS transporter [Candidatus Thorarchaeota archaeon]|jgi:DHA1 family bicyclomycin/chloramphenicol resistance-like MFS transporter